MKLPALVLSLMALIAVGLSHIPGEEVTGLRAVASVTSRVPVPLADAAFGIHQNPDAAQSTPPNVFGVERLWDTGAIWCRMNPAAGVWDFQPLLSQLDAAAGRHAVGAIVVLGFPPAHAVADQPAAAEPYQAQAPWLCPEQGAASVLPGNPAWDDYVRRTVEQVAAWHMSHPGLAVHFQVWNEPAVGWFLRPDQRPSRLLHLAARAARVVHEVMPSAKLISPSIVPNSDARRARFQQRFVALARQWADDRQQPLFDVWAVHLYPVGDTFDIVWGGPEGYLPKIQDVLTTVTGGRVPGDQVWITEINANVAFTGPPVQVLPDEVQQQFVQAVAADTAARGIPLVVWYRWQYDPWRAGNGQIIFAQASPAVAAWR